MKKTIADNPISTLQYGRFLKSMTGSVTKLVCHTFLLWQCLLTTTGFANSTIFGYDYHVRDLYTDFAVPASIQIFRDGQVFTQIKTDIIGHFRVELPEGKYFIKVESPGYLTREGLLPTDDITNPLPSYFLLPSSTPPEEMSNSQNSKSGRKNTASEIIVHGYLSDKETGQPLDEVEVKAINAHRQAVTNRRGYFQLTLPMADEARSIKNGETLIFSHPGYSDYTISNIFSGRDGIMYKLGLNPGNTHEGHREEDHLLDDEPGRYSPRVKIQKNAIKQGLVAGTTKLPEVNFVPAFIDPPDFIRIGTSCIKTDCSQKQTLSLEDYVVTGVGQEWVGNTEAFKAGAVAYRSYGVSYVNKPLRSTYDICNNTYCQKWNPNKFGTAYGTAPKKAQLAIDATSGFMLVDLKTKTEVSRTEYAAVTNDKPYLDSEPDETDPGRNSMIEKIMAGDAVNLFLDDDENYDCLLGFDVLSGIPYHSVNDKREKCKTAKLYYQAGMESASKDTDNCQRSGKNCLTLNDNAKTTRGCGKGYAGDIRGRWWCLEDKPSIRYTNRMLFGHGRGMSQEGTKAWEEKGKNWLWMLHHYYKEQRMPQRIESPFIDSAYFPASDPSPYAELSSPIQVDPLASPLGPLPLPTVTTKTGNGTANPGENLAINWTVYMGSTIRNGSGFKAYFRPVLKNANGVEYTLSPKHQAISIDKPEYTISGNFNLPKDIPSGQYTPTLSLWLDVNGNKSIQVNEDLLLGEVKVEPIQVGSPGDLGGCPKFKGRYGAVIDLGKYGKLIHPVQVDGDHCFYFWDRTGDGTAFDGDQMGFDELKTRFTGRFATINGVKLALPTVGDGSDFIDDWDYRNGTAVQGTANNPTYDDYLAIWDAYNGTGTGTHIDGTPPGWDDGYYWSATPAASGHADISLGYGNVSYGYDYGYRYVAVEVL